MSNRRARWISHSLAAGCLAAISAGVLTAQQPPSPASVHPATQASSTDPAHRGLVSTYCLSCHNTKVKAGSLDLSTINTDEVSSHPEEWETGRSKAPRAPDAARREPRPDEKQLTGRWRRWKPRSMRPGRQTKPRPHRNVAAAEPHGIPERHSRSARAGHRAAALLPGTSGPRFRQRHGRQLSPTLLDRYMSAAQKISRLAVGAERARRRRPSASRRTSRRRSTSKDCRSARAAARYVATLPARRRVRDQSA